MDVEHGETQVKTKCINCASDLSLGAKICPICKSYQTQWRNNLAYLASIASVLALLASATAYIWSKSIEIAENYSQNEEDITIVYIAGMPVKGVFINPSKADIFITSIDVEHSYGSYTLPVYTQINPGKSAILHPPPKDPESGENNSNENNDTFVSIPISMKIDEHPIKFMQLAFKSQNCWKMKTFSENHHDLLHMKRFYESIGSKILEFKPDRSYINYISTKSGQTFRRPIGLVVTFTFSSTCLEKSSTETESNKK